MTLSDKARTAYARALALSAAVDARVIRADGSGTPTPSDDGEELKDAAARAWAAYRKAKAAR